MVWLQRRSVLQVSGGEVVLELKNNPAAGSGLSILREGGTFNPRLGNNGDYLELEYKTQVDFAPCNILGIPPSVDFIRARNAAGGVQIRTSSSYDLSFAVSNDPWNSFGVWKKLRFEYQSSGWRVYVDDVLSADSANLGGSLAFSYFFRDFTFGSPTLRIRNIKTNWLGALEWDCPCNEGTGDQLANVGTSGGLLRLPTQTGNELWEWVTDN